MTTPKKETSELLTLCGKVRDGDITPAEFSEFEARLLEDPHAVDTYRRFMVICSGLEQTATVRQSAFERSATVAEVDAAADSMLPPKRSRPQQQRSPSRTPRRRIFVSVGATATVATAAVLLMVVFHRLDSSDTSGFATVAAAHQPAWGSDRVLQPNEPAETGEYSLSSGAVQVNYSNGAELLVQAPAQFSLHDQKRITLTSGVVSLYIPPAATGFRIDTPFGSAIDHGTRIGVATDPESGIELHVFEGKAELVALGSTTGKMLSANEAAAINAELQTVTSVDADQSYFASTLDGLDHLPTVSGDVELRVSPPRSVRRVNPEVVDSGRATIFAERQGVEIPMDLPVTLASPGKALSVAANNARLTAGLRVDSFLIHFVLPRDRWRSNEMMTASGQVTFARPVAGIVAHTPARTNEKFGHPSTDYPGDKLTGLEDSIDNDATQADQIQLSSDRRTLMFRLQIHGRGHAEQQDRVDQLRVLVRSNDD